MKPVKRFLKCIFLLGLLSMSGGAADVSAQGSWTEGDFAWGDKRTINSPTAGDRECHVASKSIVGVTGAPELATLCIYERPNFRYAIYQKQWPLWYGGFWTQDFFLVGLGDDQHMYVVENMRASKFPLYVSGSNDLHFNMFIPQGASNSKHITYIQDFPSQLRPVFEFGKVARYTLNDNVERSFIPSDIPNAPVTGATWVSRDGAWMATEIKGVGFVRIDMKTRKLYGFSNYAHPYGYGSDALMTFRISSDGTKIAAFDSNITPVVYSINETCGVLANIYDEQFIASLRSVRCPDDGGRLRAALERKFGYPALRFVAASGFSVDGDTLYFDKPTSQYDWSPGLERTPLYAGGYVTDESIEYLAIGDSFTSGEGDIEKDSKGNSYYIKGTEGVKQCHLSSRSYPYLLRDALDIDIKRMRSVACSGAQVLPDYVGNATTYKGQGGRVSSESNSKVEELQSNALTDFTPGIVTQLQFIEKYQPRVVTVMGGGNDVGFASILEYCASPSWDGVFYDDTCGYAIEGSQLREILGQAIESQYDYTRMLIRKVREVSPETTVYLVGYPSFISEVANAVCLNSAALNRAERSMINDGISAMNTMLSTAAASMGVKYIDIQDTLSGGRLCEGSEYVTGLNDINYDLQNHGAESFHPNAKAHTRVAERILASGLSTHPNQNLLPQSSSNDFTLDGNLQVATKETTVQRDIAQESIVVQQDELRINVVSGSLLQDSEASLTVFSNPTSLGGVAVEGDGGINQSVALPSTLKPGRHVLVLEGKSPSGEPINYYQFITVISNRMDMDGDGIANDDDHCLFITTWIDEGSSKDICLATDQNDTNVDTESAPANYQSEQPLLENNTVQKSESHTETVDSNAVGKSDTSGSHIIDDGSVKGVSVAVTHQELGVLYAIVGVSTLVGGYGILKAIRSHVYE